MYSSLCFYCLVSILVFIHFYTKIIWIHVVQKINFNIPTLTNYLTSFRWNILVTLYKLLFCIFCLLIDLPLLSILFWSFLKTYFVNIPRYIHHVLGVSGACGSQKMSLYSLKLALWLVMSLCHVGARNWTCFPSRTLNHWIITLAISTWLFRKGISLDLLTNW